MTLLAQWTADDWVKIITAIGSLLAAYYAFRGNSKAKTLDVKQDQQTTMIRTTAASIARVEKQGDELSKSQLGKRK